MTTCVDWTSPTNQIENSKTQKLKNSKTQKLKNSKTQKLIYSHQKLKYEDDKLTHFEFENDVAISTTISAISAISAISVISAIFERARPTAPVRFSRQCN